MLSVFAHTTVQFATGQVPVSIQSLRLLVVMQYIVLEISDVARLVDFRL